MLRLDFVRRFMWIVPLALGIVFIGAGIYMFSEGRAAKNDVRTELTDEKITTSADATIPGVPVDNADTAQSQAAAIKTHSLTTSGGLTYSEMKRDDPNRATYLNGVTLRTALSLAAMGFKVSDLVMGLGAFMAVVGVVHILVLAPALYWIGAAQPELEWAIKEKLPLSAPQTSPGA